MVSQNDFDNGFSDEILAYVKGESDINPFEKTDSQKTKKENHLEDCSPLKNELLTSAQITPSPSPTQKKQEKNTSNTKDHRVGHRQRLRERFIKGGAEAVADYELLELVLFNAIPRKDVKPLAKELLSTFGSLNDVVSASVDTLTSIKGISETTAIQLKVLQATTHKILSEQVKEKNIISSWQTLLGYLKAVMGPLKKEQFRILFLDRKNALIADEVQQEGTVDHTPVYPREVMKRALELHATAIILVHNHPSGDPTPSRADIEMTQAIVSAGKSLSITVHDHLVIARGEYTSFKSLGFID